MSPLDVFLYAIAAVCGLIAAPFVIYIAGMIFCCIVAGFLVIVIWLAEKWEGSKR